MPKKVKIHANERIDIPDFDHAASVYTDESLAFHKERFLLDRRSRVLDGFRVEISDQTASPGQVTVYNGNALDRVGLHLNDEDLATAAVTTTLAGASQTFYLEIEFVESDTDTDARSFWDPTYDNGVGVPKGKEVALSVSTRLTPTWRIVTPVSTSGFDRAGNPNSQRIPLCMLTTNASNQVTNVVNTGLVTVTAASVVEYDVSAGASTLKVLDSRLFGSTPTIIVDYGGTNPETVTVTSNDVENGLLSFAPVLAFAHTAGAIVRVSAVARLVKQNTDPNNTAYSTASPNHLVDQTPRFWQGDETRGSAIFTSKETYGVRDDLNVRSMKDHLDMIAGQLRELKFGSPRPEVTSLAPPTSFSTRPRYLDRVGSVAGARTASVSIGNGTTTFGDFNGTTEAVFNAAQAALPLGGTIFVKPGTYTFATTVTVTTGIHFVADSKDTTTFVNNVAAGSAFTLSNTTVIFEDITFQTGTGGSDCVSLSNAMIHAERCLFTGVSCTNGTLNLRDGLVSGMIHGTGVSGRIYNSTLAGDFQLSGTFTEMLISGCQVATDQRFVYFASGTTHSFVVENCMILATQATDAPVFEWHSSANCLNVTIDGCLIQNYTLDCAASDKPAICSIGGTGNLNVTNSYLMLNAQNTGTYYAEAITTRTNATNYVVNVANTQFVGNISYTRGISVLGTGTKLNVSGCDFKTAYGVYENDSMGYLSVVNSTFHDVGTVTWYGIRAAFVAGSVTTSTKLSIADCSFYGNNSNTSQKYGININGTTTSITGCKFEEIQNTSTGANAIVVLNTYFTSRQCAVSIYGNAFHRCYATATDAVLKAEDSTGHITVSDNVFTNCAGGHCVRIYAGVSVVVDGNRIYNHTNSGGGVTTTKAISVENTQKNCAIVNNVIDSVTALTSAGNISAIEAATGMSSCTLTVAGNHISNINYAAPVAFNAVYAISVPKNAIVTGNVIKSLANVGGLIYGIYSQSSTGRGLTVSSNTIQTLSTTAGACIAIAINAGAGTTGVTVVDNEIYYIRTTNNSATGISLSGTYTNLICSDNTIEDVYASGTSPFVYGIALGYSVLYTSEISRNKFITLNGANDCAIQAIYVYGGSGTNVSISDNQWNVGSLTTTSVYCYFIRIDPNTGSTGSYADLSVTGNTCYSNLGTGVAYFAGLISLRRCGRTTVRGNRLTFAGGVTYPLALYGCDTTSVEANKIRCIGSTNSATALYVDFAASTISLVTDFSVIRNSILMFADAATCIPLYVLSPGVNLRNLSVNNNTVVHTGSAATLYSGIYVLLQNTAYCYGLTVEGNTVMDYTAGTLASTTNSYGIQLAGPAGGRLQDVRVRNNTVSMLTAGTSRGLQINYAAYGAVSDNNIRIDDGQTEIQLFTCENLHVQNNITGSSALGTYVVADAGVITDTTGTNNTIANNKL